MPRDAIKIFLHLTKYTNEKIEQKRCQGQFLTGCGRLGNRGQSALSPGRYANGIWSFARGLSMKRLNFEAELIEYLAGEFFGGDLAKTGSGSLTTV
jgi:hypothetical protein